MGMVLYLEQIALLLQILDDCFSCLIAVHAGIFAAGCGHGCIVVHDLDDWQVMAAAYLIVVRVVCRCDFDNAGTKFHVNILVADNRDFSVEQRQYDIFANQVLIALILRVDRYCGIAQHGFRTGGCQNNIAAAVSQRITQVPEVACLLLILYLCIRDGGHAVRTPVDDALALIDEALVVQVDKHLFDCLGASVIQCEPLSVPVTGGAQLFELLDDSAAVFAFPLPCTLQEALSAQVLLGQTFLLHRVDNLCLGCDGSVVGTRQPEGFIALHPAETNQDILQGLVECVAHVQLTGDVRWWDHDSVWFFIRIWLSVEISAVQPKLVGAVFYLFGVIDFR